MSTTLLFKINTLIQFKILDIYINKLTSPCSNSSFSSDVHFKEQPGDFVGERALGMQEAEISAFPNPDILQPQSLQGYSPSLAKLKILL